MLNDGVITALLPSEIFPFRQKHVWWKCNQKSAFVCKLDKWTVSLVGLQILVAALTFFLGKDEEEKQDSDSESEVG